MKIFKFNVIFIVSDLISYVVVIYKGAKFFPTYFERKSCLRHTKVLLYQTKKIHPYKHVGMPKGQNGWPNFDKTKKTKIVAPM